MGTTRTDIYSRQHKDLATMLKALGHPARIAILQYIISQQACICNHLVNQIGLAQPTISQHLKELKNAGIIKGNVEGTSICYCIDEEVWNRLKKLLEVFMQTNEQKKEIVRQKYSEIASQNSVSSTASCCGQGCCSPAVYNIMSEEYDNLPGYNKEADLGLGCGLPTQFAKIKKGDTVVDLGSGAGNDCFVARAETGENGKVIGIDFTEAMIQKARENAEKLGYNNVEFRYGDIEKIPIAANVADVVVSNCVMNLVPDKQKAFGEVYRILKPGGHFSISDIVLAGELPEKIMNAAEMYAGCVAGALQKDTYLNIIREAGFANIMFQKEKAIIIPDGLLDNYLDEDEIKTYKAHPYIIFSITVYAEKPL
ncbi:MAG: arsenite methyltransferase [Bacteroidales bacterium]|jgi:SAM-dependent methyltransferase/DNA-binding transcriptional ArsR family regulator|nr:arsenite methyltransferase [Bacteroidales bacterium]